LKYQNILMLLITRLLKQFLRILNQAEAFVLPLNLVTFIAIFVKYKHYYYLKIKDSEHSNLAVEWYSHDGEIMKY